MDIAVCRRVVDRLHDVLALHVDSLAFDYVRQVEQYAFDDPQLLIRENDLEKFRQAMEEGQGFRLVRWNADTEGTELAGEDLIWKVLHARPLPLTPRLGYADRIGTPCPVWIQFYTNLRHGPLLLVDLADWFPSDLDTAEREPALDNREIIAPPMWARLLWQASLVTIHAAGRPDCAVIRTELDKLHEIATRLGGNWTDVLEYAQAYDDEYLGRLELLRGRIEAYADAHCVDSNRLIAALPVDDDTIAAADLDYGVFHDLRHALEALEAYYPRTLPDGVLESVSVRTGLRPRKLWYYGEDGGELGIALPGFGIREQMEQYAGLTWDELQAHRLVSVGVRCAPPQGYWHDLTKEEFQEIFAGPPAAVVRARPVRSPKGLQPTGRSLPAKKKRAKMASGGRPGGPGRRR